MAETVNKQLENIGARRLHAVLERILEDISFDAPDLTAEQRSNGDGNKASVYVVCARAQWHVRLLRS